MLFKQDRITFSFLLNKNTAISSFNIPPLNSYNTSGNLLDSGDIKINSFSFSFSTALGGFVSFTGLFSKIIYHSVFLLFSATSAFSAKPQAPENKKNASFIFYLP